MTLLREPATRGTRPDRLTGSASPSVRWLFGGMAAAAEIVVLGILDGAGELSGAPAGLLDPGPLVRVGLPVAVVGTQRQLGWAEPPTATDDLGSRGLDLVRI